MVRALDQYKLFYNDKTYFVDHTLSQIRNIDNPHDYITFPSPEDMINVLISCTRDGVGEVVA